MRYEDFNGMPEGTELEFFEPETCIAIREETGKRFPAAPFTARTQRDDFFIVVKPAQVTFVGQRAGEICVRIAGDYRQGLFVYDATRWVRAVTRVIAPEYIRGIL